MAKAINCGISGVRQKVPFVFPVFFLLLYFLFYPVRVCFAVSAESPADLRVGISVNGNNLEISFESEYKLVCTGTEETLPVGRYRLTGTGDRIEIYDYVRDKCDFFQGPLLFQPSLTSSENQFFSLHNALYGREYRGALEVIPEGNSLLAVNVLDLESYLRGVLPGEMPPAWGNYGGMEALKAQAVAARTYALYNRGVCRHSKFQLCDQQHCQVYKGKAVESRCTDQAIDETSGEILVFNSQIIEPFYHGSNGGFTELAQNVWPESRPYLADVPDPYDDPGNPLGLPDFICYPAWTVDFTLESLDDLLSAKGCYIGGVNHVEIVSTFPSGRVEEVVVQGNGGRSVSFLKEKTRTMLGLESQYFTMSGEPDARLWVVSADYDYGLQKKESFPELAEKWVIDGHNIKSRLSGDRFFAAGKGIQDYIPRINFVIRGQGCGHGVGLSQYGAYNRSRDGHGYLEILSFYFPGTEVTVR